MLALSCAKGNNEKCRVIESFLYDVDKKADHELLANYFPIDSFDGDRKKIYSQHFSLLRNTEIEYVKCEAGTGHENMFIVNSGGDQFYFLLIEVESDKWLIQSCIPIQKGERVIGWL